MLNNTNCQDLDSRDKCLLRNASFFAFSRGHFYLRSSVAIVLFSFVKMRYVDFVVYDSCESAEETARMYGETVYFLCSSTTFPRRNYVVYTKISFYLCKKLAWPMIDASRDGDLALLHCANFEFLICMGAR